MLRPALPADLAAIAAIYNEGIAGREATFETAPRRPEALRGWLEGPPLLVAEREEEILGWARVSPTSDREAYAGVGELTVYVAGAARGGGVGRVLVAGLAEAARDAGFWKLLARVFPENGASLRLLEDAGFRAVGRHERHGRLDGRWRDVVLLERLLGEAAPPRMLGKVTVRRLAREDLDRWRPLWEAYNAFYRSVQPEAVTQATFARLCDPEEPALLGLVAEGDGGLVGLAHLVFHPSTWSTGPYCYLEDLFVGREARGRGVGEALFEATYAEADARGAERVYWHTQEYNGPARSLYDQVGHRTSFVVYER